MDTLLHRFKADYFKTLAHPLRLAILECLRTGEMSVNELQVKLETDQPTLSAQLARLRAGEIVETRKRAPLSTIARVTRGSSCCSTSRVTFSTIIWPAGGLCLPGCTRKARCSSGTIQNPLMHHAAAFGAGIIRTQ